MAWTFALFVVLAPVFVLGYRPVHVPKNLFVQIPAREDGTQVIRRSATLWREKTTDNDFASQPSPVLKARNRRALANLPETAEPFNAGDFDSLLMYWPSDRNKEEKILLLGKVTGSVGSSKVYLSQDYGRSWTDINSKLTLQNGAASKINNIYTSKTTDTLCILADVTSNTLFISKNMTAFDRHELGWNPSYVYIHPSNVNYVMGFDKTDKKLYMSTDSGINFRLLADRVKSFSWGVTGIDSEKTIFVEKFKPRAAKLAVVQKIEDFGATDLRPTDLLDNVDEFDMVQNFMFATQTKGNSIRFMVSHNRRDFAEAKFPLQEENRDFFLFDVEDDQVFVVINHRQNVSNMYVSDIGGLKYTLSLPRVLYHNPDTDVSSPWLRATVRYSFVDVHKVKTMKGVYIATQLTPGPVGRRHLLTLITYDKGAVWQRIKAPVRDIKGIRTFCYLPSCSLHFNLKYGSVYRVSPSESLLSKPSAPGLILALGVASTNLKIHPDLFVSLDGGVNWKRTLRGKYQYAFGDHGSLIVAVAYRRNTRTIRYSYDGGETWESYLFSKKAVQVQDVMTQLDEKLPIFLIYATSGGRNRAWSVFFVNMTNVLGRRCTLDDYMSWIPSDTGRGFDRCLLGQKTIFQVRNWTVRCLVGKDYERPTNITPCECRRSDFQCDFGFDKKEIDEECTPAAGEDMDADLIPDNCEEGQYYNRSIGFRKIPGNACEGGQEKNFAPVRTPCPMQNLAGVNLTSSMTKEGAVSIATNTQVPFKVTIKKGYWPNILIRWDFGDQTPLVDRIGTNGSAMSHTYQRPGHYIAVVTLTNMRSIFSKKIHIYVQDLLNKDKLNVSFTPAQPRYDEAVTFLANLQDYNYASYGHVKFQWFVNGKELGGDQPVFKHRFEKSGLFNVMAAVSNRVSKFQKNVTVKIHPDLTPKNIRVRGIGSTSVNVEWDKPQESDRYITGYKILQKSPTDPSYHMVLQTEPSNTNATVKKLLPATAYYFKVVTMTKNVGEFSSVEAVGVVTNISKPGKPEEIQAESLSDTSIKLTWKRPTQTGDGITGYAIRWWSEASDIVRNERVAADVRQKKFTNLEQNTVYSFEVIALSTLARGTPTDPVFARTKVSKPSLPPRNLQHVTDNGTCAYVSWDTPYVSSSDQNLFPAEGYKVYLDQDLKKTVRGKYVQLCGLLPGATYTVRVSAYTSSGEGPRASVSFTTEASRVNTPNNLKAKAVSSTQIDITWDVPSNAKGVSFVIKQVSPAGSGKAVTVAASDGSYRMNDLKPFTSYSFSVGVHQGASSMVTARTMEDHPGIVKYLSAILVAPKSSTIKLSWTRPSEPNGVITGYKIRWSSSIGDGNKETIVTPGSNQNSYTFRHLRKSTEYTFAVVAKTSEGDGRRYSKDITLQTEKAIKGTERLQMAWDDDDQSRSARSTTEGADKESEAFIRGASKFAKVDDSRFADVDMQSEKTVEFDLLPPLPGDKGPSNEEVKATLDNGFTFGEKTVVPKSLKVLSTYDDGNSAPTACLGAQTGEKKSSVSSMWLIGIIIPIIIGIALLAGMVFYYRKYKALEGVYSKAAYKANNDQMSIDYDDLATESPGIIFSDISPKKTQYRDAEKIPLGENDELSMV